MVNWKNWEGKAILCFKIKRWGMSINGELQRIEELTASAYLKELFWCSAGLRKITCKLLRLTCSMQIRQQQWRQFFLLYFEFKTHIFHIFSPLKKWGAS
jgi:hypothetical protein